jgi:non-ribosomal peptide synthetase component F
MVGFFVNQLVLRSRVRDEEDVSALIARSRATILTALEHQELPFDRLVAELLPERDRSAMPFFQLKLILQNTPDRALQLPELRVEELEPPTPDAELDLLISVQEHSDGLEFVIDYRVASFERAYVERLGALLITAARALCDSPACSVSELVAQLEREEQSSRTSALERARLEREAQRRELTATRSRRNKVERPG